MPNYIFSVLVDVLNSIFSERSVNESVLAFMKDLNRYFNIVRQVDQILAPIKVVNLYNNLICLLF